MVVVYQMEVTSVCNLKCSFCAREQDWYKKPDGFMDLELIEKIDWSGTEYTELQFSGEPSLHPMIEVIIDRLHAKGIKVGFSSNTTGHAVLARLKKIIDKVDYLTVNNDMHRNPAFVDRDNVHVTELGIDFPIEDYTRLTPHAQVPPCQTPDNYVSVHWNGDVVPCCKDHDGVHVFGNLYEQTWDEVIYGKKRLEFVKHRKTNQPNGLCEFCDYPNVHMIHKRIIGRLNDISNG